MNINQFENEIKQNIDDFVSFWKEHHLINPEQYPLNMDDDNNGMWLEQLLFFINEYNEH
jgi:hypothetical protein